MDATTWQRWRYAAKLDSWPKLLVPAWLGLSMGVGSARAFDAWGALLGLAFTLLGLLFIVLLNDYRDRGVDTIKRQMFPDGCSPKTIPDGILAARRVLLGGVAAGLLGAAVIAIGAWSLRRPELMAWGYGGMLVFCAYTLPPIQLNYRGGGELLEAIGVAVVLPMFSALSQTAALDWHTTWPLGGYAALSLASAIASGLSDEQSDAAGGKRTLVTWLGNPRARQLLEAAVWLAIPLWLAAAYVAGALGWAWLPVLVLLWHARRLPSLGKTAVTNAFAQQKQYKHRLHLAIWIPTFLVGLGVALTPWLHAWGAP